MDGTEKSYSMTYLDGPQYDQDNATSLFEAQSDNVEDLKRRDQTKLVVLKPISTPVFFYIHVSLFAICGCLARILTDELFGNVTNTEETDSIINKSFISNMFGCFVMGALNGSPMANTQLASLYQGLTAGFCGSFTTWSKWNQQINLILVGETKTKSQSLVLTILAWFVGFYVFFGSYGIGYDFGKAMSKKLGNKIIRKGRMISDVSSTILFIVVFTCLVILVMLDIPERHRSICLALVLAPFAGCLRNWLSKFQIDKFRLPLGTLIANFIGSLLAAILHVIVTRVSATQCENVNLCWPVIAIYAVNVGFCDSLTTVSQLICEFYTIKRENPTHAYIYVILTYATCQIFAGLINGINFAVG